MLKLKIKKLHPNAMLPKYAYIGDAGIDFYALEDFSLKNMERNSVPTGITLEIPEGYVGLFWDKSSVAKRDGMKTIGGVIDSSFRGEIQIAMMNLSGDTYTFKKGQKVAQLLIQKIEHVDIVEVGELNESERGEKGFGSSGK